jgi:hypothetical protein
MTTINPALDAARHAACIAEEARHEACLACPEEAADAAREREARIRAALAAQGPGVAEAMNTATAEYNRRIDALVAQ